MQKEISRRVLEEAEYIIKTNGTVRSVAPIFGVSKSTVHNDLTKTLEKLDTSLYYKVKKVLEINLSERHLRGGEATKAKYKKTAEHIQIQNDKNTPKKQNKFLQFLKRKIFNREKAVEK